LEHKNRWWCNFIRTFKELDENEIMIKTTNDMDEKEKERQMLGLEKYRENFSLKFELTKDHEKLKMIKNDCKELISSIHN
jgi:hypothetical protein